MHEKYNLKSDQIPCEAPLSVLASATAEALAGGFAAARARCLAENAARA